MSKGDGLVRTMQNLVTSRRRPVVFVAVSVFLAVGLLLSLPVGSAQAVGQWTTGLLTNNSVDDRAPQLSSTHIVWAQKNADPAGWDIKLREIATGNTTTITELSSPGIPHLSIDGDYVVIRARSSSVWLLHTISTETTVAYASMPALPITAGPITDGEYVVYGRDDGDVELRALALATREPIVITNNGVDDYLGDFDSGSVVWERATPENQRTVLVCDLQTQLTRVIHSEYSTAATGMYPQISKDWVGYFGLVDNKLCLQRLADGLTIQIDAMYGLAWYWALTDDYVFWVQKISTGPDPGDYATDLYALHLATQQVTRLSTDALSESILAAEGGRVVYLASAESGSAKDLMVINMDSTSVQPYRLVQNVQFATTVYGALSAGSYDLTLSGKYIAAALSDGHDGEIAWAMWEEDPGDDAEEDDSDDEDGSDVDSGDGTDEGVDDGTDDAGDSDDSGGSSVTFSDVAGSPYETAIYDLAGREVISGYEDETFRPTTHVSRQQFAKMIVKALGFPVTGSEVCPFTDVAGQIGADPFYPATYVAVCATSGITQGKTATSFAPYDDITHQQLITMVVRAADLGSPPATYNPGFSASQFSLAEHYENACKAAYAGLLDDLVGIGPTYDFLAASTRGECAQILYNLLQM